MSGAEKREGGNRCAECGGHIKTDDIRGETYCEECGQVYEENLFAEGTGMSVIGDGAEQKAQHGPKKTFLRHDQGQSTYIGLDKRDNHGGSIDRRSAGRLRKTQNRAMFDSNDKLYAGALIRLSKYGTDIGVPKDTKEAVGYFLKQVRNGGMLRGRDYDDVIAGLYYLMCRKHGIPRTLDRIAEGCGRTRRSVGRTVMWLQRMENRELAKEFQIPPPQPEKFIPYLCSELKLSVNAQHEITKVLSAGREKGMTEGSGKSPVTLAAAAVYVGGILAKEVRTQREIAEVSDTTEVTIRNTYKLYTKALGIELFEE